MKKWLNIIALTAMLTSCSLFGEEGKQYQLDEIEQLEQEIIALSESVSCTNSSQWEFTAMGSKACGGPTRYIAFHQSVSDEFLDLVSQFTRLQEEYNLRYHVVSDCMLVAPPRSVTCEAGKPVLVY
jgi:hypothetical protein